MREVWDLRELTPCHRTLWFYTSWQPICCMATYHVTPVKDSSKWSVQKSGRGVISTHRKKSAAKKKAKREANSSDTIFIHGKDGAIQRTVSG